MEYPLDELLDKRSIIQLKIERFEGEKIEKESLKKEFSDYTFAINGYISKNVCTIEEIKNWHNRLYEINGKCWDLESAIRQGKEGELGLEEVGRRALKLRDMNKKRIGIKREVVNKTGVGYKDIKINHASEEND